MPEDKYFAAEFDDGIYIIDGRTGYQWNEGPIADWTTATTLCNNLNKSIRNN